MSILVPQFAPVLDTTEGDPALNQGLRTALPIRGTFQWEEMGWAAAWGLGRGGTLVMQGPSGPNSPVNPGSSTTWRWWTWPRAHIYARLWCVSLGMRHADPGAHVANGAIVVNAVQIGRFTISPAQTGQAQTFRFVQTIASPSATPAEVTLALSVDSDAIWPVYLESACCYEISRATLTEYGVGPTPAPLLGTLQTGAIISESVDGSKSIGGLVETVNDPSLLQTEMRRSCLYSDFRPGGTIVGTSYTNINLRNPSVLARARYAGESVRETEVAVYGHGPAGSNVKITADSGDSVTIPLGTSDGWTDGFQLDVKAEDPARWGIDGGIPGGTRERLAIEGQRVGGSAGDCVVYGVGCAEAA